MNEAPCLDCGTDTAPCTGRRGCRHAGRWEYYMVSDRLWRKALGLVDDAELGCMEGFYLCVRCLERRLGRKLRPGDFTNAPINEPSPWDTPLLAARKSAR